MCVACHDLRRVVNSNYSPEEWRNVVNMMVSAGTPLSAAQKEMVTAYLIKNFPGKPKPAPVIVAGPVQVTFKEWQLPTLGSRPHDPLATPTAPSGTPGRWPTCSGASIPRPADQGISAQDAVPARTA